MTFNSNNTATELDVNSEIVNTVASLIENSKNGSWSGTMTEFRKILSRGMKKAQRNELPGSPSALRVALNKVVRRISRNEKITTSFTRTSDRSRTRLVVFTAR